MTATTTQALTGAATGSRGAARASTPVATGGGFFQRSLLGRTLALFKREMAWVAVFSFFANVLMLTPTLYMMQVYDRVLVSGSEVTLLVLSAVMVLFFLTMAFAEWLRSRLLVRAGARFDEALNSAVFRSSFEASLSGAGRNSLQAFGDLTNLRQFLTGNGAFALMDAPWTVVYIAVLFLMHPWLGWTAMVCAAVMFAVAVFGHRYTVRRHEQAQTSLAESTSYLQGKLRNAETVYAMGMLSSLRQHWLALHERHLVAQADAAEGAHRVQAVTKYVQYTQQSLMLAMGALLAIGGHISAGAMIASNALMGNALRPVGVLTQAWRQFLDMRTSYARLEQLLEDHPERADRHIGDEVAGQVSLRGLVARAPAREQPILGDLTADFQAGEVIAIVGPSGAGKSTLARCIVGIWPHTEGQVLLDGHPIEEWSREHLGPHLGYLPQDIELFDGTIAENIARFADTPAEQVIEAAQRTGIHEMILRMPKGYDTPMGEAGGMLSGGQRQRIGLARAILGDPSLVVLDEPNANLDDAGEAALVRTVRELKSRGKTVFMIVHQQHLLAAADRVLILEKGQISRILPVVTRTEASTARTQA
jgi:ATP-binding cassette subfamily C exporter for protease/lipase